MQATLKVGPLPMTDADLVELIRQGDERAFANLYYRHARYLASVVLRVLGNEAELDDVIQDTFITASNYLDQLENAEKARPWLVKIAVRHARRRLKKARRTSHSRFMDQWLYPEQDVEAVRAREELYSALDVIAQKNRVPWILYRIQGLSLAETAEACGVSLATVKRRIAKAETKLRSKLDESR